MYLRNWQKEALEKMMRWLTVERKDRHFLANAAPGAGKTLFACVGAARLLEAGEIDRVVVIAPRAEVVNQWSQDYEKVTGRHMSKVTARDGDLASIGLDVCATWSAIQGLQDAFQALCKSSRVLVICDEHHHAAVEAAWGESADSAFAEAKFVLILTGTPLRSDGSHSIWLSHNHRGAINHPEQGTYTLTYGEAVDLNYCRPVTFHRHEGLFSVELHDSATIQVSGQRVTEIPENLKRVPGLQRALNFYHLACTPQREKDGVTPLLTCYQATMLEWGIRKLDELRLRMGNAGGLVIAPNIEVAEYMVELLELLEGERPMLVHSQLPNPDTKIQAFRNTDKKWLVSVAMVSEGVDIKRLRVMVYLPNALTELAFRQAIGRIVRTSDSNDDTRAYVVMPSFETFDEYARRVEEELSPAARTEKAAPRSKKCPVCENECALSAIECDCCGHEFPKAPTRFKTCEDCGALNPLTLKNCQNCGHSFAPEISITLDQALRAGAIVRGMDIDEDEVQSAEQIAPTIRKRVLAAGDAKLVKVLQSLPDESWARLKSILSA